MSSTAREIVERAGVDVDALTGKLTSAAGGELAAFYHHSLLISHSIGLADEELKEIIRDIRAEDRIHFDALVTRIYELDGRLPEDLHELLNLADRPHTHLPHSLGGVEDKRPDSHGEPIGDLLAVLLESERRAIRTYTDICDLTAGKDLRTYKLALAILNEKTEHEAWLREFRGEGEGGRFHRGFRGRAPHVSRRTDDPGPPPGHSGAPA